MELKDLYQDIIVDHNRSPRNFRKIEPATHSKQGFNPLCGDKLTVYLALENDVIKDVSFEGTGCAISVASASLMTQQLKGKLITDAEQLYGNMHALLTDNSAAAIDVDALGKLAALEGVKAFPSRVKCATLCWHTLEAALHGYLQPVSTE